MSLHSSLRVDSATAQQRSVLSRIERIKDLMKKGLWSDDKSPTGLPKIRIMKIKAKKAPKAAAAAAETPEGAAAAAPGAAPAKTPAAAAPAAKAPKSKE
ncbi:MAG TPA: small basic protein [Candidatus Omnitrophota bacterium]|nr:small basic protein [Candidatus Omnitrophota bacterium]HPD83901.1 small basic protein [Candidatus Omnitrophota bacterium]HRZ02758.1 small basic protein [Candidatus Omnitrophota bacterium]